MRVVQKSYALLVALRHYVCLTSAPNVAIVRRDGKTSGCLGTSSGIFESWTFDDLVSAGSRGTRGLPEA